MKKLCFKSFFVLSFVAGLFFATTSTVKAIGGPHYEPPVSFYDWELGNPDANTPKEEIVCTGPGERCMVFEF